MMHFCTDPLVDFASRIVSLSANTATDLVVDRLLRLHNAESWPEPITIYISPTEDGASLTVLEFLKIHAVLRAIRSPVHTVALGMLRGFEVLLLANGVRGHRYILEHSLICVEPFQFEGLPFTDGPVVTGQIQGTSLRDQAKELLRTELAIVVSHLQLNEELFQTPKIVSAAQAIALGIADHVVSVPNPDQPQSKWLYRLGRNRNGGPTA